MRILYIVIAALAGSAGLYAFLASNDVVPAPGQIACMSSERAASTKDDKKRHRVVIAQFGNDFFGEYSDRLRQGLDANAALSVSHSCDILPFPGAIRGGGTTLKPEHRAALAAEGIDAVIWGHRYSKTVKIYLLSGISGEKDGAVYGSITIFRFREKGAEEEPRNFIAQAFGSGDKLSAGASKTIYAVLRPLQDLSTAADGLKDPKARSRLARNFGMAAFHVGRDSDDDAVLNEAEQAFVQVLSMPRWRPSYTRAQGYAETVEFRLAQTLLLLGEKEPGTERLTRSLEQFQRTLKRWKGRSRSKARAGIRLEMGKAMMAIGARETSATMYGRAINEFQKARRDIRKKPDRTLQARLQFHIGLAQTEIGRHLRSARELKKASDWITRSLVAGDRDKQPKVWAERTLAKARVDFLADALEPGKKHFERAATAVSEVQSVWTKTDHPERWAEAELAHALGEARRAGGPQAPQHLKNAAGRLRALISSGVSKANAPLMHYNLATILATAGERGRDAKMLEEAQHHTERAIELLDGKTDRVAQAMALNNLGYLLELRARIGKDASALKQSIDAYTAAEAAYQDLKLNTAVVSAGLRRAQRAHDRVSSAPK
jgi:tetratricopeptide (TPR) repeat protein